MVALPQAITQQSARDIVRQMSTWPHWSEIAQVAAREYHVSDADFAHFLPEYQRFMALIAAGETIAMFSEAIDKLWHAHLLHSLLYAAFCDIYVGHFVHHLPFLTPTVSSPYELSNAVKFCEAPPTPPPICEAPPTPPPMCEAPPTPSPGGERKLELVDQPLEHFRKVYQAAYGQEPGVLWNTPHADGIAQHAGAERHIASR